MSAPCSTSIAKRSRIPTSALWTVAAVSPPRSRTKVFPVGHHVIGVAFTKEGRNPTGEFAGTLRLHDDDEVVVEAGTTA
jgi:hypothetical protein